VGPNNLSYHVDCPVNPMADKKELATDKDEPRYRPGGHGPPLVLNFFVLLS